MYISHQFINFDKVLSPAFKITFLKVESFPDPKLYISFPAIDRVFEIFIKIRVFQSLYTATWLDK